MDKGKIAEFISDINKALLELRDLDDETQDRVPLSEMVLEDCLQYFTELLPPVDTTPDIRACADEVAEGHAHNLSNYIRKMCRLADSDPNAIARCYEYDITLYQKQFDRYPSLGEHGKRTFGRNNLGVMYLNLQVSVAFRDYLRLRENANLKIRGQNLKELDEWFRDSKAFKAAVKFERGGGGHWVRDVFSFEAAAADPKGFAGLGRK